MDDMTPQTAEGKLLWHFTMSLDGFVAGPDHELDWMAGVTGQPGLIEQYTSTTGAVLGGRDGFDASPDADTTYGGLWSGPVFVLTHHPEEAPPAAHTTFLSCGVAEAAEIARRAAGGKNVEVLSASIGRQLLDLGLIDEIDVHVAPVLLGEGIRLYDNPGRPPIRLGRVNGGDPHLAVNLRFRPEYAEGTDLPAT